MTPRNLREAAAWLRGDAKEAEELDSFDALADLLDDLADKEATAVTIRWQPGDITDITNLSDEEASEWLMKNGHHIQDRSIEAGWNIISDLLDFDDIERTD